MFKNEISLPVSKKYLLLGTLKKREAPGEEAYQTLKWAFFGGPSLLFCRKRETGKTRIRLHKFQDVKMSQKVVGYDANALYPSTMLGDMPCGKEVVVHWTQTPGNIEKFRSFLQQDKWFGFAEVDIEVPRELWEKFEEMPPLFFNKTVASEAVPQHMKDYLAQTTK